MTRNHTYILTKENQTGGSHYTFDYTVWTIKCHCGWTMQTREFDGWKNKYRQHTIDVALKFLNIETGEQRVG